MRGALKARGEEAPSIGRGIGMAIGLFCIIVLTSLMQHQVFISSYYLTFLSLSDNDVVFLAGYDDRHLIQNYSHRFDL